jgi:DNA polymerase
MDIVTIDFETYYDKDYSLSKMSTEAYIRDPRFEVIGVAVKVNNYPTDWYTGDNPGKFLNSLDYSNKAILCHHAAFDGAILSWHYGIKPKLWFDTLSMSRPIHNMQVGNSLATLATYYDIGKKGTEVVQALGKRRADFTPTEMKAYGGYCINDVELTKKLYKIFRGYLTPTELLVIDRTIRMFTEPVIELDTSLLEQHLKDVRLRKQELIDSLELGVSDEAATKMLMSNEIFAKYLRKLGVEPPTKQSPVTGKLAYAFAKTDKGFTDLLEHPDERVQALTTARLGVKSTLEETRTESLIGVASRGTLPIMLNYYSAHTGRFTGGDKMNLQNLPARGGNTIRRALKAPPGHVVIACDSSQIEARMVAYIAGQDDLVEAFRQGRDVYSEFASEVYGRTITKADKVERFVGKTCILGLGYGMGAEKLRRTLEIGQAGINVVIELNEATRIVQTYRSKYHKIASFWRLANKALMDMINSQCGSLHEILPYDSEGIVLPNKLRIKYPMLKASLNQFEYISDTRTFQKAIQARLAGDPNVELTWTKIYGGKVTENLVQALAALVIREQMAACGLHYKIALQVHDEIVVVVPEESAQQAQKHIEQIMSTPPTWALTLPVACESGMAANYGDT